jgi:hypothetical protein
LRIGKAELRHVAFMVLPDDLDVWADDPVAQPGTVGLPVLLALETIQWNRNHELRIGFPPEHADLRNANLSFGELDPLAWVEIGRMTVGGFPIVYRKAPALLSTDHCGQQLALRTNRYGRRRAAGHTVSYWSDLRLPFSRPSSGSFLVAAIPAARSFAIRLMSFTGTGFVSGKWTVPFRSS